MSLKRRLARVTSELWRQIVECPRGPLTSFRAPKHRQPLSGLHIEIRSSLRSPERREGRVDQGTTPGAMAETKEPQWSRSKWGLLI